MKTIKNILTFFLLFAGVSLWADSAGRFSMVNGEVFVERGAQKVSASVGMEIAVGDRIVTGNTARAQLLFADETVITLGRTSKFVVDDYLFDEQAGKAKSHFSALEGGFRSVTGKIGKIAPDQFQLKTKTATIGIRGTKFIGKVGKDGDQIACTQGAINIKANFNGAVVEVPAGQMVKLPFNAAPTQPAQYTPGELQKLESESGVGGENGGNGKTAEAGANEEPEPQAGEGEGDQTPAADEPTLADELEEAFMEGNPETFQSEVETPQVDLAALADQASDITESVNDQLATPDASDVPEVKVAFASYNPAIASVAPGTINGDLPPFVPSVGDGAYVLRQQILNEAEGGQTASLTPLTDMSDRTGFLVGGDSTAVEYYRIDGEEWGYWITEGAGVSADQLKTQVWVSGAQTASAEVAQLMINQIKHVYNGKAIGTVRNIPGFSSGTTDAILLNGNNQVRINIDFGSATPVSGYIRFDTELGGRWSADLAAGGTVSSVGYGHSNPTGTVTSPYGGQGVITGGSVQGQFYGTGASGTGGTFDLQSGQGTATGVFSAKR